MNEERARTDDALARTTPAEDIISDADLVVQRAQADESIRAHREEADSLLQAQQQASRVHSFTVDAERALADRERDRERLLVDATTQVKRRDADQSLRIEREDHRVADEVVEIERGETDARLQHERRRTDEVVDAVHQQLGVERAAHDLSKQAVAWRDELLTEVSHELRSPLTAIGLNAQVLLERAGGLSEVALVDIAEDIQAACAQMTVLISDLLDVATLQLGRLKVTRAPGDAAGLVHEAIAASAPMLKRRSLSLSVAGLDRPLPALIDEGRLRQVFANLFANAVKFTAPGGTISVGVERRGSTLEFRVSDTGSGIPADAVGRVFERFWQLGDGDRRGLGLGLYLCKAIVEAHGGEIWVSSEVGVGSSFFFTVA